ERGALVSIETVSYNEGTVEVIVRNNGNAKASIRYASVEANGDTLCLTSTYLTLEPGDSSTLKLNCYLRGRQQTYTVKVIAEGGEARYVFIPG
ncbi:MAG: CARDB domain-containing protein, partial [Acidilobaceae archaeon]